jgi:leucyl/phenylalanyl-tRNA---protein transferase
VLKVAEFKLHRSLRKTLADFLRSPGSEIRIDHDFPAVIASCANFPREGQSGTWIVPEMQAAYIALHRAGLTHSIETWINGELAGGLYCTAIGSAVFGESMFAHTPNASKIALSALVALCQAQGVRMIDCQQNTSHLASLGAREMAREEFCEKVACEATKKSLLWLPESVEWKLLDARLDHPAFAEPMQLLPTNEPIAT